MGGEVELTEQFAEHAQVGHAQVRILDHIDEGGRVGRAAPGMADRERPDEDLPARVEPAHVVLGTGGLGEVGGVALCRGAWRGFGLGI